MAKTFKRLYIDGAASMEELLVWNSSNSIYLVLPSSECLRGREYTV